MPPLSDLAFFDQLIKAGSLTLTAQQLGLSTAAISKRLSQLEKRLGIRLLQRTTRRMTPTPEGLLYLQEGRRILGDLHQLEETLMQRQQQPQGLLRVNVGFGFGRTVIAPRLPTFLSRYPAIDLQLTLTDRPLSLIEDDVDVGIRFGQASDSRVIAKRLAPNHRLLCAAPAYLAKYGIPTNLGDLSRHQCIDIRERDETFGVWRLQNGSQQESVRIHGQAATNDGETAVAWALAAQGIILRSYWHIAPLLRAGKLVNLLPDWRQDDADIHAIYPEKKHQSAKIIAFVDFLTEQLADHRF